MSRKNAVALILGGGRGTRLAPLTTIRSKPAVPLGGMYRLIDVPISNCINSGINQIYVLTQFMSVSLHGHIRRAYTFDNFSGGFVELLAAQETPNVGSDWYQGTADAVRKNLLYFDQPGIGICLVVLSGHGSTAWTHGDLIETHRQSKADVTISCMPVTREDAKGFGVMQIDDSGRVTDFVENRRRMPSWRRSVLIRAGLNRWESMPRDGTASQAWESMSSIAICCGMC